MSISKRYFALVEGGGTKFNCAIANEKREILVEKRIPTTSPSQTISAVIDFFNEQKKAGFEFHKLGLACFGPLDLNPNSQSFGSITSTPKAGWSNVAIKKELETSLSCDVSIDTDVNAAALAEFKWGASQNTTVSIYITVGTGVGGGVVINGQTLKGLVHPELGHMLISGVPEIKGVCPFHGNCVEGLAAGKSMEKIWDQPAENMDSSHPAWQVEAKVLGNFCHNLLVSFSPQSIVLGGGVMAKKGLLEQVVANAEQSLKNYIVFPYQQDIKHIITAPGLGERSGLLGALALIMDF
ncbi:ROK family protein [Glaciecola sp. MH2013]|uniref:ROK family protein n=1 Tax=Glaciecola sp. MH2013 TaxID=2785524 RepID=UPI00189D8E31|nr:ROK family protein [Glaciecola sp. MH2013]MBF7073388.1 ROK family protein [Glaciecola sp. MH2013]